MTSGAVLFVLIGMMTSDVSVDDDAPGSCVIVITGIDASGTEDVRMMVWRVVSVLVFVTTVFDVGEICGTDERAGRDGVMVTSMVEVGKTVMVTAGTSSPPLVVVLVGAAVDLASEAPPEAEAEAEPLPLGTCTGVPNTAFAI